MHIGIDLGTTFCCVAYIDDAGLAKVIPNSEGELTTPSVIWFDGKKAYVGKKANLRKETTGHHIFEFIKREMGKPVAIPPNLYSEDDPQTPVPFPGEINGFQYGADGLSAIILRKLKKEAIRYLKNIKQIDQSTEGKDIVLDAVITVPAYFRDKERQMTFNAGRMAGLNVVDIIEEPTAAALTYGLCRKEDVKFMVFDLGGGTFDVTILEVKGGEYRVITKEGAHTLGGKDWDAVIQQYIHEKFREKNGKDIPDDKVFDIQDKAIEAKKALSDNEETAVSISIAEGDLDLKLYMSAPKLDGFDEFDSDINKERPFYFDERSSSLLSQIRTICKTVIENKNMEWGDIDEILLAGGACRMPMIPEMLEELTGKKIKRHIAGFNYDTAIAIGAAHYVQQKGRVKNVVSHSIGVKYVQDARPLIDHLIKKDTHLPAQMERRYIGGPNSVLEVYEGESIHPDECTRRGRIPLNDVDGHVTVRMELDEYNVLKVRAHYPPHTLEKKFEGEEIDDSRLKELREKVHGIDIRF